MKIILSRKGFDSGFGGVASPIFPDLRFASLPIPLAEGDPAKLAKAAEVPLGTLLSDLTRRRFDGTTTVHMDPDLDPSFRERARGWRPSFGQVDAAQAHLVNQHVGVGDLFLFFGWFRHVEQISNRWRYIKDSPDIHSLFGWLEVGEVVKVDMQSCSSLPEWLWSHPHVKHAKSFAGRDNTIYLAAEQLGLDGSLSSIAGGGTFRTWSPALTLTANGEKKRSVWNVPTWMYPVGGRPPITYHGKASRWRQCGDASRLESVARGQEFVLDTAYYPEATAWAKAIIADHQH